MERLPDTLWPASEPATGLISFGSISVDGWFLLSYLIGLAVLIIFSWKRLFHEQAFTADDTTEKVLRLLPPGDLRGTVTLLRAFVIYALLMCGLYTLISFGGAFLWKLISILGIGEIVGTPDGSPPFKVDDPAWPLGVSLAFVGIFNHIPKLDIVELTIRRLAHQSIGIPPFIKQLTQKVLRVPVAALPNAVSANYRANDNRDFIRIFHAIETGANPDEIGEKLDRIAILDTLVLRDRAEWPSAKVITRFERMVKELRTDVRDLFDNTDGAAVLLEDIAAKPAAKRDTKKQDQAERKCEEIAARADRVNRDLSALVAVYIENDPKMPETAHPSLKSLVTKVQEQTDSKNSLIDKMLLILVAVGLLVFVATYFATEYGYNPAMGPLSAARTAIFQCLLMILIYVPGASIGFRYQQSREESGRWKEWPRARERKNYPMQQYFAAFFLAYVPVVGLIAALFLAFFISIGSDIKNAFQHFVGAYPGYLTYAALAGMQAVFSAFAYAEVKRGFSRWTASFAHAVAVIVLLSILYNTDRNTQISGVSYEALVYWFVIAQAAFVAFITTYLSAESNAPDDEAVQTAEVVS